MGLGLVDDQVQMVVVRGPLVPDRIYSGYYILLATSLGGAGGGDVRGE